ncbi:hypothetical protein Dda_5405 [Drechslerella dactyloides]|uniref:BTB domain-containing protein n=1 Tax=Drechslerella dactyloides TaxID=74499 RepID=A0AAD6NIT6_DREDA|nr:hypothetical protein Dda_5405 [Drechslerella dactyloides]
MTPLPRVLPGLAVAFSAILYMYIVPAAAFAGLQDTQTTDIISGSTTQSIYSPIEEGIGGTWLETVTRMESVIIVVHPHSMTHAHSEYAALPDTTGTSPGLSTSTTTLSSTAETLEITTSASTTSTTIAESLTMSFSNSSSTTTAQTQESTSSSDSSSLPTTESSISSSSTYTPSTTITTLDSVRPPPPPPTESPPRTRPLDSAEAQTCTGGSLESCIAAYDCTREPMEVMRCSCRNNVAMGCRRACGVGETFLPEECPLLPVGERPKGLPGAGDSVSIPRIKATEGRPLVLDTGRPGLEVMLQRPVRMLEWLQNVHGSPSLSETYIAAAAAHNLVPHGQAPPTPTSPVSLSIPTGTAEPDADVDMIMDLDEPQQNQQIQTQDVVVASPTPLTQAIVTPSEQQEWMRTIDAQIEEGRQQLEMMTTRVEEVIKPARRYIPTKITAYFPSSPTLSVPVHLSTPSSSGSSSPVPLSSMQLISRRDSDASSESEEERQQREILEELAKSLSSVSLRSRTRTSHTQPVKGKAKVTTGGLTSRSPPPPIGIGIGMMMGYRGPRKDVSMGDLTTTYNVDKNYDCEVRLKEASNEHVYRVSAAALRLASPVLAKMVDPKSPWAKRQQDNQLDQEVLVITLHDDHPEALDILLQLMHFQKQNIPEHLDLKRIFYLALVCDKYDCVDVAKSLIHEFTADWKEAETNKFWDGFYNYTYELQPQDDLNSTNTGEGEDGENGLHGRDKPAVANMLLYVSFVFSLEGIFPKAYRANLMIWQPKKRASEPDDVVNGPICLPDKLYKHFMAEWEEKRNGIVSVVNQQIQTYTYGLMYGNQGRCLRNTNCTLCDIALYGSFIRRLHYMGLFPIQEKSDALSLYELCQRVKSIQIGHYWEGGTSARYPHDSCVRSFMATVRVGVEQAVEESEVKLADFKIEHGIKRKLWVLENEEDEEDDEPATDDAEDEDQDYY